LAKFVPIIGSSLGAVSVPVISGALTHAVGHTFITHFEAGGTFSDFDPKSMRKQFEVEVNKAKDIVAKMRDKASAGADES
jgi:hypothetical protein